MELKDISEEIIDVQKDIKKSKLKKDKVAKEVDFEKETAEEKKLDNNVTGDGETRVDELKNVKTNKNIYIKRRDEENCDVLTKELENEILGSEQLTRCGFGCIQWGFLQHFARADVYLLIFSIVALGQGIYFSYSVGTLTTIERRFKFPSKISGFISTGNDVIQILLSLHISQVAGQGHRPRWIAVGLILTILACVLSILPHVIYGTGTDGQMHMNNLINNSTVSEEICFGNGRNESLSSKCELENFSFTSEQITVIVLLFMGQVFTGIGSMLFYTVGYTYLDEAVSKDKVPFYFAISGMMRVFGPVTGYALSSWALKKWIDPSQTPTILPTHPKWIGAWWLGYPVLAGVLLMAVFFLAFLPKTLPSARRRNLRLLRAYALKGRSEFEIFRHSLRQNKENPIKEMGQSLKRLLKNKIYMLMNVNQLFFWASIVSYFMFVGKYIEQNFAKSASEANRDLANYGLISTSLGWIVMGSVITFLKPKTKSVLITTVVITFSMIVTFLSLIAVTCDQQQLEGLELILSNENDSPYLESQNTLSNISLCMQECNCSRSLRPICVKKMSQMSLIQNEANQVSFYNPCFAGCSIKQISNLTENYEDCRCVKHLRNFKLSKYQVTDGFCESSCKGYSSFLVLNFILQILVAANRAIANIIFFRSVNERDKDLSLGLLNVFISTILIIGPLTVGSLIDFCCELWEKTCGTRGYCYIYNLMEIRWTLHIVPAAGLVVAMICEILLLRHHKEIDLLGEKEKENLHL